MGYWDGYNLKAYVSKEQADMAKDLITCLGYDLDEYPTEYVGDIWKGIGYKFERNSEYECIEAATEYEPDASEQTMILLMSWLFRKSYIQVSHEEGNDSSDAYYRKEYTFVSDTDTEGDLYIGEVDYCEGEGTAFDEYYDDDEDLSEVGTRKSTSKLKIQKPEFLEEIRDICEAAKEYPELASVLEEMYSEQLQSSEDIKTSGNELKEFTLEYDTDREEFAINQEGVLTKWYGKVDDTDVYVPEGVIEIGESVFEDRRNIEYVALPDGVQRIGKRAFCNCSSLDTVEMPDSIVEIGDVSFAGTSISYDFVIPEGVKRIGEAAFEETCLDEVVLPQGLTEIEAKTFQFCKYLKQVNIPENVQRIGERAFANCERLKSVSIPSAVTEVGRQAFYCCTELSEITIPFGVKKIGDEAFAGCAKLTINVPKSIRNIGAKAFHNCRSLRWIDDDGKPASLNESGSDDVEFDIDSDGNLFGCRTKGCRSITIPKEVKSIGESVFEGYDVTEVVIPEGVEKIGARAFSKSCIRTMVLPNSVYEIGEEAFDECWGLSAISIPDAITVIPRKAFRLCRELARIRFPKELHEIGEGAFEFCVNLTEINLPDHLKAIRQSAFLGCDSIEAVKIPQSVEEIEAIAFGSCEHLKVISVPDSIKSIPYHMVADNDSLISVSLPKGLRSIGEGAFLGCRVLQGIEIPDGVTEIEEEAFSGDVALKSITLPEGVTVINHRLFSDCKSLQEITILGDITSIGENAFNGCVSLGKLRIPDSVEAIYMDAFSACRNLELTIPKKVKRMVSEWELEDCKCVIIEESPKSSHAKSEEQTYSDILSDYRGGWDEDSKENQFAGLDWMEDYGEYFEENPVISICGSTFVFTGFGHDDVENHPLVKGVIEAGGLYRESISGATDYLVVNPSEAGQYKISKAVEKQEEGSNIQIILYKQLEKALGMDDDSEYEESEPDFSVSEKQKTDEIMDESEKIHEFTDLLNEAAQYDKIVCEYFGVQNERFLKAFFDEFQYEVIMKLGSEVLNKEELFISIIGGRTKIKYGVDYVDDTDDAEYILYCPFLQSSEPLLDQFVIFTKAGWDSLLTEYDGKESLTVRDPITEREKFHPFRGDDFVRDEASSDIRDYLDECCADCESVSERLSNWFGEGRTVDIIECSGDDYYYTRRYISHDDKNHAEILKDDLFELVYDIIWERFDIEFSISKRTRDELLNSIFGGKVAIEIGDKAIDDADNADYVLYCPWDNCDNPCFYSFTKDEWKEFLSGYKGRGQLLVTDEGTGETHIHSFYGEDPISKRISTYIEESSACWKSAETAITEALVKEGANGNCHIHDERGIAQICTNVKYGSSQCSYCESFRYQETGFIFCKEYAEKYSEDTTYGPFPFPSYNDSDSVFEFVQYVNALYAEYEQGHQEYFVSMHAGKACEIAIHSFYAKRLFFFEKGTDRIDRVIEGLGTVAVVISNEALDDTYDADYVFYAPEFDLNYHMTDLFCVFTKNEWQAFLHGYNGTEKFVIYDAKAHKYRIHPFRISEERNQKGSEAICDYIDSCCDKVRTWGEMIDDSEC